MVVVPLSCLGFGGVRLLTSRIIWNHLKEFYAVLQLERWDRGTNQGERPNLILLGN